MRISTSQFQRQSVEAMLEQQARVSKTQQQLASGQRILTPADDPSASARLLNIREAHETASQYQRNGDVAAARLAQEETALEAIGNLLQGVRELAVQADNGSQANADRAIIAQEVRQHLDELLGLANTQDAGGEYLFGGFKGQTPPFSQENGGGFSYQGDQGRRLIQIGPSVRVADSDPGSEVFMGIPNRQGGNQDMFIIVQHFIDALEQPVQDKASQAQFHDAINQTLTDLDQALEQVRETRAGVGARLNTIEREQHLNGDVQLQLAELQSSLGDLDYAEAVSRLNQQLTGLEAAQRTYARLQDLSLFNFL